MYGTLYIYKVSGVLLVCACPVCACTYVCAFGYMYMCMCVHVCVCVCVCGCGTSTCTCVVCVVHMVYISFVPQIFRLEEIDTKTKIDTLFKKNLYPIAIR